MPIKEIYLRSAEEVLLAMQFGPTPAQMEGQDFPTWKGDIRRHWVFRGHGNVSWEMIPKAWRGDYLASQARLRQDIRGEIDRFHNPAFDEFVSFKSDFEPFHFANFLEWRLTSYFARYASQLGLLETTRWHHNQDHGDLFVFHGRIRELGSALVEYLDTLSIAQHYEVATRLLDFSFNPMKALSFAVYGQQKDADQVCVYALNIDEMPYVHLEERLNEAAIQDDQKWSKFFAPHSANKNIFAQEGLFITMIDPSRYYNIFGKFPVLDDDYRKDEAPILYKLIIDGSKVIDDVKTMLVRLQCTPADLMPSLSRCAETAQSLLETVVAGEHGSGEPIA